MAGLEAVVDDPLEVPTAAFVISPNGTLEGPGDPPGWFVMLVNGALEAGPEARLEAFDIAVSSA